MPEKDRRPFVILTYPRSGSTWLVSLLNQVDGITAYGEMFLPRKRADGKAHWDDDFTHPRFIETDLAAGKLRPLNVFRFLDDLYHHPGAVGFKLMSAQLQRFPELLVYFLAHRVRVIHLIRRNTLDQVISQALTVELEQAHRFAGQEIKEGVQVELNTSGLVAYLRTKQRSIRRTDRLLRLLRLPTRRVFYEELQSGSGAFQAICLFLSVPPVEKLPESRFVKIRQESQADVLKNYGEVREALQGTPFISLVE